MNAEFGMKKFEKKTKFEHEHSKESGLSRYSLTTLEFRQLTDLEKAVKFYKESDK